MNIMLYGIVKEGSSGIIREYRGMERERSCYAGIWCSPDSNILMVQLYNDQQLNPDSYSFRCMVVCCRALVRQSWPVAAYWIR